MPTIRRSFGCGLGNFRFFGTLVGEKEADIALSDIRVGNVTAPVVHDALLYDAGHERHS